MKTQTTYTKLLTLTGVLGVALLMSACQTAPTPMHPTSAVTCNKCRTVWIEQPANHGVKPGVGYYPLRSVPMMTCPECESAVATFFRTGQLRHHCKACGGTLGHCADH